MPLKRWIGRQTDIDLAKQMAQTYELHPLVARILAARGYDVKSTQAFLSPARAQLLAKKETSLPPPRSRTVRDSFDVIPFKHSITHRIDGQPKFANTLLHSFVVDLLFSPQSTPYPGMGSCPISVQYDAQWECLRRQSVEFVHA